MTDLYVNALGEGARVVLVHGSGGSSSGWVRQLPLASRFKLLIPDRRGYGRSPFVPVIDYEKDAVDIADLMGIGAHLVGESYGAVVVLLAAALRPEAVLSLTVVEPPLFSLVRGNPAADEMARRAKHVFETMRDATPEEFAVGFNKAVGFEALPTVMEPEARRDIGSMMKERVPTDAQVPYGRIKCAPFKKMVVSGGWSDVFEAICDELAGRLGAERVVLPGQGHSAYLSGEPFNTVLERFIVGSGIV